LKKGHGLSTAELDPPGPGTDIPDMVRYDASTNRLCAKIVYYGPGLCGKTTNLRSIHAALPDELKSKMLSLATKDDRTLIFDFVPVEFCDIQRMKTCIQLYTVPGQVAYNETRKLVLKGTDGVVFVADSQNEMMDANVASFRDLEENLKAQGLRLSDIPYVMQFNKRDLPNLASVERMNATLNAVGVPYHESVATTGRGVHDTLKSIVRLVMVRIAQKYDWKSPVGA
jgi:signal recognition particle receptor subunit beta